jgi:sn-glycerol 3-phosphate transport system substrate-binding protein
MVEMGKQLTIRDDAGNVSQWGVRIPSSGFPSWLFTGLVAANGQDGLANDAGTEVYFDTPEVVEALEYLVSLSDRARDHGPGHPRLGRDAARLPRWRERHRLDHDRQPDQYPQQCHLRVRRRHAAGQRSSAAPRPVAAISTSSPVTARRDPGGAIDFVKWATAPEQAAEWSIATGYVAPREDTWETDAMREYAEEVPGALVARDQLEYAVAELATFEGPRITQILNDNIAAAIVGDKTPAEALADAQREADAILAPYQQ